MTDPRVYWLPHVVHAAVAAIALAGLASVGLTPEVMQANGWWTSFLVVQGGVFAGNVAMALLARQPDTARDVVAAGRTEDLQDSHRTVVEQLRNLEAERHKLTDEDYQRERATLLAVGAEALRQLDQGAPVSTGETGETGQGVAAPSWTERVRALRDEDPSAFDAALATLGYGRGGVSGEWRGAAYTLGVVALVGLLFTMAGEGSRRRTGGMGMTGGDGAGPMEAPAAAPSEDPRLAAVKQRAAANPADLVAQNELTEAAIAAEDMPLAMQANQAALKLAPDDPDAQVFQAVLRAFIGRKEEALAQLEAVATKHPRAVRAWIYIGLLTLASDPNRAVGAFEKAIAIDDNPQLRMALAEAKARAGQAPGGPPPATPPAPDGPTEPIVSGRITAPAGATGQVLFVNIRSPEGGGPPLAAKKLAPGPFPMEFTLTTADLLAMGGVARPLPPQFTVAARLDSDGDPMSKPPTDPQRELPGITKGATNLELALEAAP